VTRAGAPSPARSVIWHDLECGTYEADLPLWRELAAAARGPVLDVGAGTGRVALDLARHGHDVTALDSDPGLLAELTRRAGDLGLVVRVAQADARDLALGRRFGACLAPMQLVQLLGGSRGRRRFLARARDHLVPGGLLALAIAERVEPFEGAPVVPDEDRCGAWTWRSQATAVRDEGDAFTLERVRDAIGPDGSGRSEVDVVRLDKVTVDGLIAEGEAAGLRDAGARSVAPTADHVGSQVVVLGA
jgi:SAM-dependent methyltransferase